MKHTVWIAGALLLTLISCRQESDYVLSYAFYDQMAFEKADSSFAGKFDVFWHGMNTNYALWDFEKANGLDWDEVYDSFRPRFAALDAVDTLVSDKQLQELMEELVAPLHDGHLAVQMKNHVSGKTVSVSPSSLRIGRERSEEMMAVGNLKPSVNYYVSAGEVIETRNASSSSFLTTLSASVNYLKAHIEAGEEDPQRLALYQQIYDELVAVLTGIITSGDPTVGIDRFNTIAYRYEYLQIPVLKPVDKILNQYPVTITYALFKGNIAYLTFDSFVLSAYVYPEYTKQIFGTPSPQAQAVIDEVAGTWQAWFDAIQTHHKAGDLGGVIIDIRSNGGGFMNDYQYVLGALLPSGGYQVSNARFKRGTGRYDYSPVISQFMPTMDGEHVVVTEPIVALCNCASVSMAEQTSMGVKLLSNGTLIGTRTWGGFSALVPNEKYSDNYSGYVGVRDETPVFCFVPQEVAITLDGQILEGYGVTPDIEIPMDVATWMMGAGPDNQLDRALQYIRNGN